MIERKKRTILEVNKAMNSINPDLEFTIENENDFENGRLPTLAFEIWSCKEGIRHSYFEKKMRSQILTMKQSSQSENSKISILTNELNRRFQMMDENISTKEKIEKIEKFTQQLVNSGYQWSQIRNIVVSSLRFTIKRESKQKENGENRYRTAVESLEKRIRSKLLESTEWYKREGEREMDEEEKDKERELDKFKNRSRRKHKRSKRNTTDLECLKKIKESGATPKITGVLFVPHTEKSELSKRIREKLKVMESISSLRVKVVERTGEK